MFIGFLLTFVREAQPGLVSQYFLSFSLGASCVYQSDFYASFLRIIFPRTTARQGNSSRIMYIRFLAVDGAMNFDAKKHEIGDIGSFSNRNVPFVKARMGEVVRRSRRNFGREGTWESSINNSFSYNWLCLSVTNVGESPASIPLVKEGFQLRRIPIRSSRDRTILALSPGSGFNSSLGSKWALELFSIWA